MCIIKLLRKLKPPRKNAASTDERYEIALSGSGGQGIVLAGKILAEAASIYDGKEAVMTKSYGPEARGGTSRTEVVISTSKIYYPKVTRMDALLVMTQEALDKYGKLLDPEALLVVDNTFIKNIPGHFKNVFQAPFSSLAVKILDAPIVANIVALGALVAVTGVVSREALIQAVIESVPAKAVVADRVAIDTGFKAVKDSGFNASAGPFGSKK